MLPCLDAAGVRSIVEVGAFAGDLTRVLVEWAQGAARTVAAVDPVAAARARRARRGAPRARPDPRDEPRRAAARSRAARRGRHRRRPQLLHGQRGAAADRRARARRRAAAAALPRRRAGRTGAATTTSTPSRSPRTSASRCRRAAAGSSPASRASRRGGLPYPRSAEREGGERNGVLTAVEDFVAEPRAACGSSSCRCSSASAWSGTRTRRSRRARAHPRPVGPQPGARAAGGQPRPPARARAPDAATSCGPSASGRAHRRRCCGGCWSRARSRSPSGCRGCACAPASPPTVGDLHATRSGACSTTAQRG